MPSILKKLVRGLLSVCQPKQREEDTQDPQPPAMPPKPVSVKSCSRNGSSVRSPRVPSSVYSRPTDGGSSYRTEVRSYSRNGSSVRSPRFPSSVYSRPTDGGSTYTTKAARRARIPSSLYSRPTDGSPYCSAGRPVKRPSRQLPIFPTSNPCVSDTADQPDDGRSSGQSPSLIFNPPYRATLSDQEREIRLKNHKPGMVGLFARQLREAVESEA